MPPLKAFVLAAIYMLVPVENKHIDLRDNRDYIVDVSVTIADAINENPADMRWKGPAGRYAAATFHIETLWRESGFREEFQTCARRGDDGRSITGYQLMLPWALQRRVHIAERLLLRNRGTYTHYRWEYQTVYTVDDLCSDPKIAARQALHIIGNHMRREWMSPHNVFQAYVSGNPNNNIKRVQRRCVEWEHLSKKMGLADARKQRDGSRQAGRLSCWRSHQRVVFHPDRDVTKSIRRAHEKYGY